MVTLLNCAEPGLDSLRFQGYRVDAEGRPTFLYALGPVAIEDHIAPAEEGAFLRRVIVLRTEVAPSPSLRVRASVAKTIHDAGEKTYVVNDRT